MRKKGKKRSIFYKPAHHPSLAEIVSLESPAKARKSVRELKRKFKSAKSRDRKRIIKQATVLAANRAKAARKRKNLSSKERKELEEIAEIYERAYKEMKL